MDLASVDEEILRQKLVLCNLFTQRNSLSAISRLPNELLGSIFVLHAADYFESHSTPSLGAPPWVKVSYVCTRWRDVALSCPVFWSYIFTSSQRWTEVLLDRSEQAPLKIRIDWGVKTDDSFWWSDFVERLMNHVRRIEEFRVHMYQWNKRIHQIFSRLFSGASNLLYLEYSMAPLQYDGIFDQRTLAPWHSYRRLGTLTTLRLSSIPPSLQQGTAKFLAMLGGMPNLTHLYIVNALASARDFISRADFDTLQKIDLPRLSRLSIRAPLSTIIAFLSCVNTPARTETRLACCSKDDHRGYTSLDGYSRFCSSLAQRYDKDWAHSVPTIRSVAIESASDKILLIFGTTATYNHIPLRVGNDIMSMGHNILLMIFFEFGSSSPWPKEATDPDKITFLSDICSFMPVTNIQTLHVINPPYRPVFWKTIFGHLPELRRIRLVEDISPFRDSTLLSRFVRGLLDDSDLSYTPALGLKELELCYISTTASVLKRFYNTLSKRVDSQTQVTLTACKVDGISQSGTSTIACATTVQKRTNK